MITVLIWKKACIVLFIKRLDNASTSAVCRFKSAYIASFLYPTLYKREDYNVWEIRGYYGQHIELEILDLEMKNELKINSFLEVFDVSLQGKQTSIIKAIKPITKWYVRGVILSYLPVVFK
jgi:hypothetical protein